ncbi:MAG TPA: DNA gyrase inhibitor YacG [Pyrinomonadaceae bacterium]|nr:DNA gyrase inhibitor YacG [Pyrinomonadaceae bacterium]
MPKIECPQCGKETEFTGNEYRPFCSERCKLLDLGAWADGDYAVPADITSLSSDDLAQIEAALEKKDE